MFSSSNPLTDKPHLVSCGCVSFSVKGGENVSEAILTPCARLSSLIALSRHLSNNGHENAPLFRLTHPIFQPEKGFPQTFVYGRKAHPF